MNNPAWFEAGNDSGNEDDKEDGDGCTAGTGAVRTPSASAAPSSDLERAATVLAGEQRISEEDGPAGEVSVLKAQLERAKQDRAAYTAARVADAQERLQRQHAIERGRLERQLEDLRRELAELKSKLQRLE